MISPTFVSSANLLNYALCILTQIVEINHGQQWTQHDRLPVADQSPTFPWVPCGSLSSHCALPLGHELIPQVFVIDIDDVAEFATVTVGNIEDFTKMCGTAGSEVRSLQLEHEQERGDVITGET